MLSETSQYRRLGRRPHSLVASALDREIDGFADANLLEFVCQIHKPMHRLPVCSDNDVAGLPIFRIHAA
jgi:hypothetical protein